jgi:hypothetical protein
MSGKSILFEQSRIPIHTGLFEKNNFTPFSLMFSSTLAVKIKKTQKPFAGFRVFFVPVRARGVFSLINETFSPSLSHNLPTPRVR